MLYNPSLLSPEDLDRVFIVRRHTLDELLGLLSESVEGVLQHVLLIGSRGMGKTTMICRLALAIQTEEALRESWRPIVFDEEQYNFGELADLWLNALEALATEADSGFTHESVRRLSGEHEGEALRGAAYQALRDLWIRRGRKLLLLIDNIDLLLERLSEEEAKVLRTILQHEDWLMVLGTASHPIASTYEYHSPFYGLFRPVELPPLGQEETERLLTGLAVLNDTSPAIKAFLEKRSEELCLFNSLMGGNVRTLTILFQALGESPDASMEDLLNHVLDLHSQGFKDRVEALAPLGQQTFDALAMHWNPTTADQVATRLRVDRGVASAQLHRLTKRGYVEKVDLPGRAMGFLVSERFFNIWMLMRGRRRNRNKLQELLSFMAKLIHRAADDPFEQLVDRLGSVGQLTEETKVLSATLVEVVCREDREPQQSLGFARLPKNEAEQRAQVLAACQTAQFHRAAEILEAIFRQDPLSLFGWLVRGYVGISTGTLPEVASDLDRAVREPSGPLGLLLCELRTRVGRLVESLELLEKLIDGEDLPTIWLLDTIHDLARSGDDDTALTCRALINRIRRKDPESRALVFTTCDIETILGRHHHALDLLVELTASCFESRGTSDEDCELRILHRVFRIAANQGGGEALGFIESVGAAERWKPLVYALEHLTGKVPHRLEGLAPELRSFTEMVIQKLDEYRAEGRNPAPRP